MSVEWWSWASAIAEEEGTVSSRIQDAVSNSVNCFNCGVEEFGQGHKLELT